MTSVIAGIEGTSQAPMRGGKGNKPKFATSTLSQLIREYLVKQMIYIWFLDG